MSPTDEVQGRGVVIAARNGPVIEWDDSGLVMRLSDLVVRDIARRIGGSEGFGIAPDALGDIDAWDVFREGDWLGFQARLASGVRRYRRHATGGAILARTGGPVWLLAGLGGARRRVSHLLPLEFPHHVLRTPFADEGERALAVHHRSVGVQALVADRLMAGRFAQGRALRTVLAEDAGPEGLAGLVAGQGRLCDALGQPAQVLAVGIDFDGDYDTALAQMAAAGPARIVTSFDSGAYWQMAGAGFAAQARLALRAGVHDLTFAAAGYAFAQDALGFLTPDGLQRRAMAEAAAIEARLARQDWFCPTACFAEAEGDRVRVTFKAMSDLVLETPAFSGDWHGFSVEGGRIEDIRIAGDDARAILLRVAGDVRRVGYAIPDGQGRAVDGHFHPNGGGVRDGFAQDGLHRWALPFDLPVTQC